MGLAKLLEQCLYTKTPFIHNGYSYVEATPHRSGCVILIRTATAEGQLECVDSGSSSNTKCQTDFFEKVEAEFDGGGFVELPELLAALNIRKCMGCRGSKIQGICYECKGISKLNFMTGHHEYSVTCKTCNGTKTITDQRGGVTDCDHCGGSGNWYLNASQPVPMTSGKGMEFNVTLYTAHILKLLDNVQVKKCSLSTSTFLFEDLKIVLFKFDGGEGIICD